MSSDSVSHGLPLFVGGFPSGGTDLTKTLLNAHPEINLAGEFPLLHTISRVGFSRPDESLSGERFDRLMTSLQSGDVYKNGAAVQFYPEVTVRSALRAHFGGEDVRVWGNKTPQNTENAEELQRLLPDARFLIVVRDPRDTALSWNSKWGKDVVWAAHKWSVRMAAAHAMAAGMNESVRFVRFENLLTDPETELSALCSWLGLGFSDRMLRHHEFTDGKDGKRNYGESIKQDNFGKWRRASSSVVERIEEVAYPTMVLFGYEPAHASESRPMTSWEKRTATLRDAIALVAVGNRSRQDNSFRRRLEDVDGYLRRIRRR